MHHRRPFHPFAAWEGAGSKLHPSWVIHREGARRCCRATNQEPGIVPPTGTVRRERNIALEKRCVVLHVALQPSLEPIRYRLGQTTLPSHGGSPSVPPGCRIEHITIPQRGRSTAYATAGVPSSTALTPADSSQQAVQVPVLFRQVAWFWRSLDRKRWISVGPESRCSNTVGWRILWFSWVTEVLVLDVRMGTTGNAKVIGCRCSCLLEAWHSSAWFL